MAGLIPADPGDSDPESTGDDSRQDETREEGGDAIPGGIDDHQGDAPSEAA